jgi:hypothetical protein
MTVTINGTSGVTTPGVTNTGNETITGTLTAGSFNAASTFGFKNRLINGAMKIAQRGTSGTSGASAPTTSPTYPCVDRFYVYATGATVTASQTTSSAVNYLSIAGAASVTAVGVGQRIEANNCIDLAGTTATLSLNISNSLLTTVTWTASYATSADTWSAKTQIATGTFTVTSTLTNYSTNISIPSAATTGIEILFTVGAQTSGTWVMNNIQLEPGSVATTFDYRPYGTELALCMRYYQYVNTGGTALGAGYFGSCTSGSPVYFNLYFPVVFRTAPTITTSNPNTNAALTISSVTGYSSTAFVQTANAGGTSTGAYLFFNYTATAEL